MGKTGEYSYQKKSGSDHPPENVDSKEGSSVAVEGIVITMSHQEFGSTIKKARVFRCWERKDLAKRLEIGVSHLSRIEDGDRIPSDSLCRKIAKQLNFSPETFVSTAQCLRNNKRTLKEGGAEKNELIDPIQRYLKMTKEIEEWMASGKISPEKAQEIVSDWESIAKYASLMISRRQEEGMPHADHKTKVHEP